MTNKIFTVVITNFNGSETIKEAIESVLNQTLSSWKLLIIDDASTDNSVKVITPYLKKERVKLIRLPKNIGQGKALNVALEEVDTPFFVQLDADDWLVDTALEDLQQAIEQTDSDIGLYYANSHIVYKENGKIQIIKTQRYGLLADKYEVLKFNLGNLQPRCYRTSALKDVGGWDTDDIFEGRVMEDRRICLKLIEKYKFHWIDKILYYYRRHTHQMTQEQDYMEKSNFLRKSVYEYFLHRWGNEYRPIYTKKWGWLVIDGFLKNKD